MESPMSINQNWEKEQRDNLTNHYNAMMPIDLIVQEANIAALLTPSSDYPLTQGRRMYLELCLDIIREVLNHRLYGT